MKRSVLCKFLQFLSQGSVIILLFSPNFLGAFINGRATYFQHLFNRFHSPKVVRKSNNKITQTGKACTKKKVPDQPPPRVAQSDHGLFCLLFSYF